MEFREIINIYIGYLIHFQKDAEKSCEDAKSEAKNDNKNVKLSVERANHGREECKNADSTQW